MLCTGKPGGYTSLRQVDLVTGTAGRLAIPEMVRKKLAGEDVLTGIDAYGKEAAFEELPGGRRGKDQGLLKIQDGCRQFCTYCNPGAGPA